jgi:hypothetical protein
MSVRVVKIQADPNVFPTILAMGGGGKECLLPKEYGSQWKNQVSGPGED